MEQKNLYGTNRKTLKLFSHFNKVRIRHIKITHIINCCGEQEYPDDYEDSPSADPDNIRSPTNEPIFDSSQTTPSKEEKIN